MVENVESKQIARREILKQRLKKSGLCTAIAAFPMLVCLILTIVFACKIPTVKEDTFIVPTIVCGVLTFIAFIVCLVVSNKLFNDLRMRKANERLSATEDGKRLVEIRAYKAIYKGLLSASQTHNDDE